MKEGRRTLSIDGLPQTPVAGGRPLSSGRGLYSRLRGSVRQSRGSLRGSFLEVYSRISSSLPNGYALPPLQAIVELTHRCNLSCSMCFIYRAIDEKNATWTRREMTEEEIIGFLNQFPRTTRVTFTGGEPFARQDIMSILRRTRARHRCGIGSNGTMLNTARNAELVDLGIDFIQFSLDGPEEVHDDVRGSRGAFAKTVAAIQQIQLLKRARGARRPWLYLNCTITATNVHVLDRVVEIADELGVEYVTFQVVFSSTDYSSGVQVDEDIESKIRTKPGIEAIDIDELKRQLRRLDQLKAVVSSNVSFQGKMSPAEVLDYYKGEFDLSKERCIFPWVNAWVSPYGEMFPCFSYSVGQLDGKNALALWNGKRFREFRMKLRENRIFPACLGCCHMRRHGGW